MECSLRQGRIGSIAVVLLIALAATAPSVGATGARAAGSADLVVNGTLSAGASGFTSQYAETKNLSPPQTFTIGLDPAKYNGNWPTIKPHAAVGMMMIANGAIKPNKTVWTESLAVKPHASYVFALWLASLYASPPVLRVQANGATLGSITASETVGAWKKLSFTWASGSARRVRLVLVDTNLAYGGNDFALSEIALTGPAA